ncbi:MAG: HAMP domain-containing histidine kinase [Candidatus Heimdallarchaeota archaeon]|nr:HAMP domain-containing histidine kinase [Candidatus Heimdallarchaeota archaeon]MCG3257914.1 HAMP domain-containing histidine kinase [Candidatus Heimdallarchaeota archaeon]MCK4612965.1 HAMP domain-containing histidine kinase [Candidatus Heimdallarchaeota archaeon]
MDEDLVTESLVEFLKLLANGDLLNSRIKISMIQRASRAIKNALDPVLILVSYYDHENQFLYPLCIEEEQITKSNLEIEMDAFDPENPYTEVFAQSDTAWFPTDAIAEGNNYKVFLKSQNISDFIVCPMYLGDITIGAISVFLHPDTVKHNQERYLSVIKEISLLITDMLSFWYGQYSSGLKLHQTDLIVEMSTLTLETTEIQLILDRILPKIKSKTEIEGLGVFIKDIAEISLIQDIGLSDQVREYFKSPQLVISSLPYYNTPNKIEEINFTQFEEQYGVILPIGSTNLMLGFLVVISESIEKLSESNIHFLRIMANQLFLTLQRKRLLDDIQQITQTSEFSSFPVMLVNNRFEIIYLNKQAEKTFSFIHDESIGLKLDYLLGLDSDKAKEMLQKTRDVIANIAKDTMKLEIEIFQLGKRDSRTFFVQLSPTINNLTGEYCVVLSLVDISEATKLQSIAEEYSNRSKMYLNVLTHDIYNILFGISGYYELLTGSIPPEENVILERVNTLVRRGTGIVQDIRLLSNVLDISSGAEVHFVPLKMTILRLLEKVEEEHSEKELNIDVNLPSVIKILGGVFLYDMFYYVLKSLILKTESRKINIDINGREIIEDDQEFFEIMILDKEGIEPELNDEIQRVIEESPFDETLRKHLGFLIVNEIAKKYDYSLFIEDIDKEDWTKGLAIKIKMQKFVENEKGN